MINKIFKKSIFAVMASCMMLVATCPLTAQAATIDQITVNSPGYGVVNGNGSSVKVWREPSSSIQVGALTDDSEVMIIGQSGSYYKVQYNVNGSTGYVAKSAVNFIGTTSHYLQVDITSGVLYFRERADSSSNAITSLADNKCFAYKNQPNNTWYEGVYGNRSGYTSQTYTELRDF